MEGGGADAFLVSCFLLFRKPLLFICTHMHVHLTVWRAAASAMAFGRLFHNCCPLFRVPLQLLYYFTSLFLPPLLTCLGQLSLNASFLLQSLCAAFNNISGVVYPCESRLCLPSTLLSLPITCLAHPHPLSVAQTTV